MTEWRYFAQSIETQFPEKWHRFNTEMTLEYFLFHHEEQNEMVYKESNY